MGELVAERLRWVMDITEIATDEGPVYLAAILELFSRKVVAWSADSHMEASLVLRALDAAIASRRPEPGFIHHSDRGCQIHLDGLPSEPH